MPRLTDDLTQSLANDSTIVAPKKRRLKDDLTDWFKPENQNYFPSQYSTPPQDIGPNAETLRKNTNLNVDAMPPTPVFYGADIAKPLFGGLKKVSPPLAEGAFRGIASTAEGMFDPALQATGVVSGLPGIKQIGGQRLQENLDKLFPGGRLNIIPAMEKNYILGEANTIERITQMGAEMFGQTVAVLPPARFLSRGKLATTTVNALALFGTALAQLKAEQRQGQEIDWGTEGFFLGMPLVLGTVAARQFGAYVERIRLQKHLKPMTDEMRAIVEQPAFAVAMGASAGIRDQSLRTFGEQTLAAALGLTAGVAVTTTFPDLTRARHVQGLQDQTVLATQALATGNAGPAAQVELTPEQRAYAAMTPEERYKFDLARSLPKSAASREARVEGAKYWNSSGETTPSDGDIRFSQAQEYWRNVVVWAAGEKLAQTPTVEELAQRFGISPENAQFIVDAKITPAMQKEIRINRQAEIDAETEAELRAMEQELQGPQVPPGADRALAPERVGGPTALAPTAPTARTAPTAEAPPVPPSAADLRAGRAGVPSKTSVQKNRGTFGAPENLVPAEGYGLPATQEPGPAHGMGEPAPEGFQSEPEKRKQAHRDRIKQAQDYYGSVREFGDPGVESVSAKDLVQRFRLAPEEARMVIREYETERANRNLEAELQDMARQENQRKGEQVENVDLPDRQYKPGVPAEPPLRSVTVVRPKGGMPRNEPARETGRLPSQKLSEARRAVQEAVDSGAEIPTPDELVRDHGIPPERAKELVSQAEAGVLPPVEGGAAAQTTTGEKASSSVEPPAAAPLESAPAAEDTPLVRAQKARDDAFEEYADATSALNHASFQNAHDENPRGTGRLEQKLRGAKGRYERAEKALARAQAAHDKQQALEKATAERQQAAENTAVLQAQNAARAEAARKIEPFKETSPKMSRTDRILDIGRRVRQYAERRASMLRDLGKETSDSFQKFHDRALTHQLKAMGIPRAEYDAITAIESLKNELGIAKGMRENAVQTYNRILEAHGPDAANEWRVQTAFERRNPTKTEGARSKDPITGKIIKAPRKKTPTETLDRMLLERFLHKNPERVLDFTPDAISWLANTEQAYQPLGKVLSDLQYHAVQDVVGNLRDAMRMDFDPNADVDLWRKQMVDLGQRLVGIESTGAAEKTVSLKTRRAAAQEQVLTADPGPNSPQRKVWMALRDAIRASNERIKKWEDSKPEDGLSLSGGLIPKPVADWYESQLKKGVKETRHAVENISESLGKLRENKRENHRRNERILAEYTGGKYDLVNGFPVQRDMVDIHNARNQALIQGDEHLSRLYEKFSTQMDQEKAQTLEKLRAGLYSKHLEQVTDRGSVEASIANHLYMPQAFTEPIWDQFRQRGLIGQEIADRGTRAMRNAAMMEQEANWKLDSFDPGFEIPGRANQALTDTAEKRLNQQVERIIEKGEAVADPKDWVDFLSIAIGEHLREQWGKKVSFTHLDPKWRAAVDSYKELYSDLAASGRAIGKELPYFRQMENYEFPLRLRDEDIADPSPILALTNPIEYQRRKIARSQYLEKILEEWQSKNPGVDRLRGIEAIDEHVRHRNDPWMNSPMAMVQKLSNLELSREIQSMTGRRYDPYRTWQPYFKSLSTRVSLAREFEPDMALAKTLIEMMGKDQHDPGQLTHLFDTATGQNPTHYDYNSFSLLNNMAALSRIRNFGLAAPSQISSWVQMLAGYKWHSGKEGPLDPLVQALHETIDADPLMPNTQKDKLKVMATKRLLYKIGGISHGELAMGLDEGQGFLPKAANAFLIANRTSVADRLGRSWGQIMGYTTAHVLQEKMKAAHMAGDKKAVEGYSNELKDWTRRDRVLESYRKRLEENPWSVSEPEMEYLARSVGFMVSEQVHGLTRAADLPPVASHKLGRWIYSGRKFGIRRYAEFKRRYNFLDPESSINNPATRWRAVAGLGAELGWAAGPMYALRRAILNDDRDNNVWQQAWSAVEAAGFAGAFADASNAMLGRYYENPSDVAKGMVFTDFDRNVIALRKAIQQRSLLPIEKQLAANVPQPFRNAAVKAVSGDRPRPERGSAPKRKESIR